MNADSDPAAHPDTPFTVGDWLVDPLANELHRDAATVKLEPKVMRVLCTLAERPGTVVAREELESRVWAGMVVTSDAVTNTIIKLRKVFGDDSRHPSYIETISKTGYRLIAEVGPGPTAKLAPGNPSILNMLRPARWLVPLMAASLLGFWLASQDSRSKRRQARAITAGRRSPFRESERRSEAGLLRGRHHRRFDHRFVQGLWLGGDRAQLGVCL